MNFEKLSEYALMNKTKSDYNKLFGSFLKQKRESKEWTQTDLASLIGNNSQNISRMERGEISPTVFWLEKLAESFECKVSELLNEFESYREKKSSEENKKKDEAEAIL